MARLLLATSSSDNPTGALDPSERRQQAHLELNEDTLQDAAATDLEALLAAAHRVRLRLSTLASVDTAPLVSSTLPKPASSGRAKPSVRRKPAHLETLR